MSPDPVSSEEEPAASDAQLYFLAIERTFIQLRGAPLYLSPADWKVARAWHEEGIPLELVERTLRELFERRKERRAAQGDDAKRDTLVTLRYCRRSVEAAWKRQRELLAPALTDEAPKLDLAARLGRLAEALPEGLEERETWVRRVVELAEAGSGTPDAEAVEEALKRLDAELLASVRGALGAAARTKLAEDLGKSLAVLARRLPAAEIERARPGLEERLLRQHFDLPVLSLFTVEADEVD